MNPKKILVLLGHPNKERTLSYEYADVYEKDARLAGHEVHRINIADLSFDPILHKGYQEIQALEPDLQKVQEEIRWCDHLVMVYPIWWSTAPALLKGMIDRMWLPAFAFRFIKGPRQMPTLGWHKLLQGKTARVIILLKNLPILERFMYGNYTANMVDAVLRFSGFRVRITEIGNVEALSEADKVRWTQKIAQLAQKGA